LDAFAAGEIEQEMQKETCCAGGQCRAKSHRRRGGFWRTAAIEKAESGGNGAGEQRAAEQ
jgi:hypothetical protein